MKRKIVGTAAFLAALALTGCGAVKIGRINADPTRYANHKVEVTGTVTNSFGVLGTGGYQIADETGRIYVISSTGVPSKGSRVRVRGRVMSGAEVMGKAYGTAIRESHHSIE
ncbi:MAG TPA: hypothetical protein VG675_15620 [Bryobacteraceae bacterium]|nr:hypothetical protein [Bryobacteraceae bacterium]